MRAGDLPTLTTLFSDDVVWHSPGDNPFAGDIVGRDALLRFLGGVSTLGFWLTEHDVFGNDEHVCALSHMGARRERIDVQTRVVSIFQYRDGLQTERWFYSEDPQSWDEIFGG